MSDSHATHDSHDSHASHDAPTVPETVIDEAGDSSPKLWLFVLVPVALVVLYVLVAPNMGKLFTAGRPPAEGAPVEIHID